MFDVVRNSYKKYMLTIENIWFGDFEYIQSIIKNKKWKKTDVVMIHAIDKEPDDLKGNLQYSLVSDLSKDEEEIFKKVNKNYRYEIRRTAKEAVSFKVFLGKHFLEESILLGQFEEVYNNMYEKKGLKERFNRQLIISYLESNNMLVTVSFFEEKPYVFHCYIYNKYNARLFYSASSFREDRSMANFIGRMNKALHWYDMKLFKSMGVHHYDWGGITNKDNPNGIDTFKMAFGGEVVSYYNFVIGITVMGKLACAIR